MDAVSVFNASRNDGIIIGHLKKASVFHQEVISQFLRIPDQFAVSAIALADSSDDYKTSTRGMEIKVYVRWSQGDVQNAEAERIMHRYNIIFQYQSAFEMDRV